MPIKKLLKYIKKIEINETLAVGIIMIVLAIPTFIFLEKEGLSKTNMSDKATDDIAAEIVWEGKIHQRMTYGRILLESTNPDAKYKYFIAEPTPDDVVIDGGLRYSPSTRYLKDTDIIKITGVIESIDCYGDEDKDSKYLECIPWVAAKIEKKNNLHTNTLNSDETTSENNLPEQTSTNTETLMEAIKYAESQRPLGIKGGEDILDNPYIRHIRIALNGYLEGTNNGVENPSLALDAEENTECGLENFDKSYYKSKFLIYSAENNDYGGVTTSIVFVDNPDTIFWTWVYNIGGDNKTEEEYTLRGFCEKGPYGEDKDALSKIIREMIKSPEFTTSCPNSNCLI